MLKLAIEDVVEVPVKFTLKQGKVNKIFSATLIAKRLNQEQITAQLEASQFKFKDFMESEDLVTGWEGQRLVLDEQGQSAPFTPEAFSMFLSPAGVAQVVFDAYQKECGAKAKN